MDVSVSILILAATSGSGPGPETTKYIHYLFYTNNYFKTGVRNDITENESMTPWIISTMKWA